MTEELFPISTVTAESPRLRWIKKHGVVIQQTNHEPRYPDDPRMAYEFEANGYGCGCRGLGDTEDDALADWARRNGVKLWNEETT